MRRIRLILYLVLGLCLILFSSVQAFSSANYRIDWMVPVSHSGGSQSGSASYSTYLTIGQTVIGVGIGDSYTYHLGFWYETFNQWFLHLPLIRR
jgi:hypothetical protein